MDRSECRDCGMPCEPNEYHPYAACLMFRGCHNSATVRANLPPPPAEQASGEHGKHMAVLERLERALPDVGLNGWIDGVAAVRYARAALSQRPVVDEAMVDRACGALFGNCLPGHRAVTRLALTAALAPQQPDTGEGA